MIEQGLVMLVQSAPAVAAIALKGGFLSEAPKDEPLPTWTYMVVSDSGDYMLDGAHGLTARRIQIDCYGETGAECIRLFMAIDNVLSGYSGVLPDPDHTRVHGCFGNTVIDFFDDASRTFRRMVEYEVWFTDN